MNIRRGLCRLWLVLTLGWLVTVGTVFSTEAEILIRFHYVRTERPENCPQLVSVPELPADLSPVNEFLLRTGDNEQPPEVEKHRAARDIASRPH